MFLIGINRRGASLKFNIHYSRYFDCCTIPVFYWTNSRQWP